MPASKQMCLALYFPSLKTDILLHGTVHTSKFQGLFLNLFRGYNLFESRVTEIRASAVTVPLPLHSSGCTTNRYLH